MDFQNLPLDGLARVVSHLATRPRKAGLVEEILVSSWEVEDILPDDSDDDVDSASEDDDPIENEHVDVLPVSDSTVTELKRLLFRAASTLIYVEEVSPQALILACLTQTRTVGLRPCALSCSLALRGVHTVCHIRGHRVLVLGHCREASS